MHEFKITAEEMNLQAKRSSGQGKILNYNVTHRCVFYSYMKCIQGEHAFHFFLPVKTLKNV